MAATKHHHAKRRSKQEIQIERLQAKVQQTEAELRRTLIHLVVDLQIAAGTKRETERTAMILAMSSPRKYPKESLQEIRRILVTVLSQRNTPKEQTVEDQPGYIQ